MQKYGAITIGIVLPHMQINAQVTSLSWGQTCIEQTRRAIAVHDVLTFIGRCTMTNCWSFDSHIHHYNALACRVNLRIISMSKSPPWRVTGDQLV